ncbi:MAG: DUF6259 domain-containing protein, partial [Armatimonadetes bacterium]|nr:DUF6259 domain-containing protein [Armatimonadota bacterium]
LQEVVGSWGKTGWNILLESENQAPFEGKRSVKSLEWRIQPYLGEWRNGASIYRDWHRRTFKPDPNEEPSWVREIRAEIHCGTDPAVLDALVGAGIDPKQTLLYVSNWRTNTYDVNYPDYTPADHLAPFIERAHRLGFRVMLHVNHFGCDPKMPDYERFKRFHVRHRYSGELQWWEWPNGKDLIKFAYINPASRRWRQFFVAKMKDLVSRTGVDAIHLDQTLCIYNDRNGLIDGLNMAQGNLLLHKELKSALPNLVLGGEGLNEVTMIHESFAQRHVAGIDHVNRTWTRSAIRETHPICAYLFGSRTKPYDYLGSGSPENDQYRLAWRDAFRHWGVLPGFGWPNVKMLSEPSPSVKQALDEIIAHQRNRLDPCIDGPWPAHVNFPYRSASGESFAYVSLPDGWALCQTDANFKPVEDLVRVITGVRSAKLPGTIPGAIFYDRETIFGLDPSRYYVYFPEPRDLSRFHIECEEDVGPVELACFEPSLAFARLGGSTILIGSSELLSRAEAYWLTPSGKRRPLTSEIAEHTGVVVHPRGSGLFMHPQWKGDGIGVGSAEVVFSLDIPRRQSVIFSAKCRLESGAEGKSDGVVFRAIAECCGERIEAKVIVRSFAPENLSLPLERFSGKRVSVRITASAGPKRDPSFDWGVVDDLRVIVSSDETRCKVVVPNWAKHLVAPVYWDLDLDASVPFSPEGVKKKSVAIPAGGAVMITSLDPTPISADVRLSEIPQINAVITAVGFTKRATEEPSIDLAPASCGGIERKAIFAHPPDGGMRMLHYFIRPVRNVEVLLKTAVGLADEAKSDGVRFAVWLNGRELWSKRVLPEDGWIPVEVSLGKLAGDPVMLTLVTESDGSYYYDWALWEDPALELIL